MLIRPKWWEKITIFFSELLVNSICYCYNNTYLVSAIDPGRAMHRQANRRLHSLLADSKYLLQCLWSYPILSLNRITPSEMSRLLRFCERHPILITSIIRNLANDTNDHCFKNYISHLGFPSGCHFRNVYQQKSWKRHP